MSRFRLISYKLCPYVRRAVIVAAEKGVSFERVDIDLAEKPDWFRAISPTGKVPLLEVRNENGTRQLLFESAVIAEYLDEISGEPLLPGDPLARARERAWIEFASATLNDIGSLYSSPSEGAFEKARAVLAARMDHLEAEIREPWFAGDRFGLVDAAFAPAFRYFDVFEWRLGRKIIEPGSAVRAWREALATRSSVRSAVASDYAESLIDFVIAKGSFLGALLERHALEPA